jgi:hypothetical protein
MLMLHKTVALEMLHKRNIFLDHKRIRILYDDEIKNNSESIRFVEMNNFINNLLDDDNIKDNGRCRRKRIDNDDIVNES